MWIFLSDAMFSIVAPDDDLTGDQLLVRARFKGDIRRVFPSARVSTTPQKDYRYRALVPRYEVWAEMADRINEIDYPNFKNTVAPRDHRRHDAYSDVWTAMFRAQDRPPIKR
jgi:hypothetical protein